MIEVLVGALTVCMSFFVVVICVQHSTIKRIVGVLEGVVETLRTTLISVTGKEEAELRRLALAKKMSQPKTQYPTDSVTKEFIEALRRRPGIRHKGERKSFTMTSQDETEENNAPLSGTEQESTDSHP